MARVTWSEPHALARRTRAGLVLSLAVAFAGCAGPVSRPGVPQPNVPASTAAPQVSADLPFVRGYRGPEDACQLVGESAFTVDYLDDAADLVACPTASLSMQTLMQDRGVRVLLQTGGHSVFRVPYR